MKELPILVLLSAAVLLCHAVPDLEQVTCSEDSGAAAARLAMHHIIEHHDHGYKFRLNETRGFKVEKVDNGCNTELQLDLLETKCHVVNPKHFEDCDLRTQAEQEVMANCTVMMTVKDSDANVTKYECVTRQVKTGTEMVMMCPDCPRLIPLNSTEGLKSVNEGVKQFNQNTTNKHYFILQEVGRIKSGYVMNAGMNYYAEFVLVETHCPMGSRIIPEACKPLCPDRAHHALCRSSYCSTNGLQSFECDLYLPLNTTDLGPGEKEPVCRHSHFPGRRFGGRGHSRHADGGGHSRDGGWHSRHADGGGHSRDSGGHSRHADGGGHSRHADGGWHSRHADCHADGHADGEGHPPHAGGGGHPPHAGAGGPPPHAGAGGPPPGHERLQHKCPFNSYHTLKHGCRILPTNFDPALHPICPWPQPEHHHKPKPSKS